MLLKQGINFKFAEMDDSSRFDILHYAKSRNSVQLENILSTPDTSYVNIIDELTGSNSLHLLFSEVCWDETCQLEAVKCTQILIKAGININLPNKAGYVPLFLALKNDWNSSAVVLATSITIDFTSPLNSSSKETVGKYLADQRPEILCKVLDQDVHVDEHSNFELHVDFKNILQYPIDYALPDHESVSKSSVTQSGREDETAFLHSIAESAKNTVLFEHPVLLLFLQLKYRKLQPMIILSFVWHAIIIFLYTTYIYLVYVSACPFGEQYKLKGNGQDDSYEGSSTTPEPEPVKCIISVELKVISGILTVLWVYLIGTEAQILVTKARRSYFTKQTIPWFIFYILMPITLWPSIGRNDEYILKWRYPVAAINIFLIWALCIDQFSKIQRLSIIFEMFTKVALKIFSLTLFFIPLITGFTIAFFIMDAENIQSVFSLITVMSMMIGDLAYNDLFEEGSQWETSVVFEIISNIIYVLFLLLMSVVFINFILALTINDIKELWGESERSQTRNKIQLMYIFDRLRYSGFKVFDRTQTKQRSLVYSFNVDETPSGVSRSVIKKLRRLAIKNGCRHATAGTGNNAAIGKGELSSSLQNLNYNEAKILYEAMQLLERKLNISRNDMYDSFDD